MRIPATIMSKSSSAFVLFHQMKEEKLVACRCRLPLLFTWRRTEKSKRIPSTGHFGLIGCKITTSRPRRL